MAMTNYMELLTVNQPWNLIIYMLIPVVLAETLVATEFFTVFLRDTNTSGWKTLNKWLGIILGFYFLGVFLNLTINVLPGIHWRGAADVLAIGAYLGSIIPLFAIVFLEFGFIGKNSSGSDKLKLHFLFLIAFLVINHTAMIFGMLDPTLMGWNPSAVTEPMQHMQHMGHQ